MPSNSLISDGDVHYITDTLVQNCLATGSVMHWMTRYSAQGQDYSDWAIFLIKVDANNYIGAWGNSGASTVTVRYRVGGVNYDVTFTPSAWTVDDWIAFGCSWNAPGGYLRVYWDGTEVGTPIALPSAISTASATIYYGWEDNTKPLFGRRDRFDLYDREMSSADFSRFVTQSFL